MSLNDRGVVTPALTTVFTPSPSCLAPTYTLSPQGSDSLDGSGGVYRGYNSNCYPSGVSSGFDIGDVGFFSPGVCPSGYISANTEIDSGTTTVNCCPALLPELNPTLLYGCSTIYNETSTTIAVVSGSNIVNYAAGTLYAAQIIVVYQSTDLPLISTLFITRTASTASPGQLATSLPTATSNTVSSSTVSTAVSSARSRTPLSSGAEAGIGIGIALALILIFFTGFMVVRRRSKLPKETYDVDTSFFNNKAELPGEGKFYAELDATSKMPPEIDHGNEICEMGGSPKTAELSGIHINSIAEVEGDSRLWEMSAAQEPRG